MAVGRRHGQVIGSGDVVDVSDWLAASGDGGSRLVGRHGFDRREAMIEDLEHVVDLVVQNRVALQPDHLAKPEKMYRHYHSYHYVYKTSFGGGQPAARRIRETYLRDVSASCRRTGGWCPRGAPLTVLNKLGFYFLNADDTYHCVLARDGSVAITGPGATVRTPLEFSERNSISTKFSPSDCHVRLTTPLTTTVSPLRPR